MVAAFGCTASANPPAADLSKTSAITQPADAAAATSGSAPAEQKADTSLYYVDFRVAQDGVVGHTYIAHGRLGANGRPATAQYVDYHPEGGFGGYLAGFIAPIAPVMRPAKETLASRVVDNYRVTLSARDYRKLTKLLSEIRASRRPWTAFGYNCNDLLADAARALGMSAPMTNIAPYQFIPTLREMNQSILAAARGGTRASASQSSAAR
jgi:hypothetical protein